MLRALFILALAGSAFGQLKQSSFLVAFPEIAYDAQKIYFVNETWTAVYSGEVGAMFTVPRDSLVIPTVKDGRTCQVIVGNATYSCNPLRGDALVKQDALGSGDKVLTPPSAGALTVLADAWKEISVSPGEMQEELGPLAEHGERVWFGLVAHRQGKDPVGGLGWYDTRTDQFGRVYGSGMEGLLPRWLGVRQDTVWMFAETVDETHSSSLIGYSLRDGRLMRVDPRGAGIPGDKLLNVAITQGLFLLSTEQCVSVWPQGISPWVWQTDAYATRDSLWLQFLTFDGRGKATSGGDFFPLKPGQPAQAFARVGDWLELLAPQGIEARMNVTAWDRRSQTLGGFDWGCGDEVCAARVKIASKGSEKEMDLLDTPIVFIERVEQGVKVGIQAGWVKADQVVPVLMKK